MNILTLDIGTSSMRGILFDSRGTMLARYHVPTPPVLRDAYVEQEPSIYRQGTVEILRRIGSSHKIDAICVTGFRSAVALVDAHGNALCNFIMWQDRRNAPLCQQLQAYDTLVWQRSGAAINPVFSATRIAWLKQNCPDLYQKAAKAVIVPDYIVCLMTGQLRTDRSYGSRTHLMNLATGQWDDRLLELFGVDKEKLCQLCDPGEIVGHVTDQFAADAAICPGIPVISAGGDQQCGALGLGLLEPGSVAVNCGTGAFALTLTEKPQPLPGFICNVSAIPGSFVLEANILSGAAALDWLRNTAFSDIKSNEEAYAALNALALESKPGGGGVYCLPHFQGCGSRSWGAPAKAVFSGLTLGTSRGDLVRAMYEGLAAEVAKSLTQLPIREDCSIVVGGGMSRSDVYLQIMSDMTGHRVLRHHNAQATAIGAYASGAVRLGLAKNYAEPLQWVRSIDPLSCFEPEPGRVAFYQGYLKESERIFRLLWAN